MLTTHHPFRPLSTHLRPPTSRPPRAGPRQRRLLPAARRLRRPRGRRPQASPVHRPPSPRSSSSAPASARTSATWRPARRSPPSSRTAACTPGCGGRPVAPASGCASSSAAPRRPACRTPAPTSSCARSCSAPCRTPQRRSPRPLGSCVPAAGCSCSSTSPLPEGSATRRLQRLVRPGWSWLFEGCQVDRDTAAVVRAAPFRSVSVDAFRARTAFLPVNSQIAVVAVR